MGMHEGSPPLAVCYGTRPQIIKASALVPALRNRWSVLTVDTGQHYDYRLNQIFYEQLEVPPADLYLEVGSGNHAVQTSAILTRSTDVYAEHNPWAVVVIGDTNSTLGCTLAAVKMRIPVIHVEAGLRGTDGLMAEEINRRVVDAVSAVLCTPSAAATDRLHRENAQGYVATTGDVAFDVLRRNVSRTGPDCVEIEEPFVLATLHRAELTDDVAQFRGILSALGTLGVPVLFPVHPRTRALMSREGLDREVPASVHVRDPLGYLEILQHVGRAAAVVTDSGGVQREAYWLGTPCITLRTHTEWVETVALGANVLVPPTEAPDRLARVVTDAIEDSGRTWDRTVYGAGDAADRIAAAIQTWSAASHRAAPALR